MSKCDHADLVSYPTKAIIYPECCNTPEILSALRQVPDISGEHVRRMVSQIVKNGDPVPEITYESPAPKKPKVKFEWEAVDNSLEAVDRFYTCLWILWKIGKNNRNAIAVIQRVYEPDHNKPVFLGWSYDGDQVNYADWLAKKYILHEAMTEVEYYVKDMYYFEKQDVLEFVRPNR